MKGFHGTCPECGAPAPTRSVFRLSPNHKRRYRHCSNPDCGAHICTSVKTAKDESGAMVSSEVLAWVVKDHHRDPGCAK